MTSDGPYRSETILCEGCGGFVPLAPEARQASCPYCGHIVVVLPEVRERLASKRDVAERRQADLDRERDLAGRAGTWGRIERHPLVKHLWVVVFAAVGLCVILLAILPGMTFDEARPLSLALIFGTFLAVIGWQLWKGARRKRTATLRSAVAVRCPGCGAEQLVKLAAARETCASCGAALVPSRDALRALEREAAAAAQEAQRTRRIAEWSAAAPPSVSPTTIMGVLVGTAGWLVLSYVAALALARSIGALGARSWFIVLCGIGIGVLGLALWLRLLLRRRRQAALQRLADELHGTTATDQASLIGWLASRWDGPYDEANVACSPEHVAAEVVVDGYSVLVDLDPTHDPSRKPRAVVLVACDVPGAPEDSPLEAIPARALARVHELSASETKVSVFRMGLLARIDDALLPKVLGGGGPRFLRDVIKRLVDLARLLDAPPRGPRPLPAPGALDGDPARVEGEPPGA